MDEVKQVNAPSKLEFLTGWLLASVSLIAFLALPNTKMPNGDALGWGNYLDQYASADGNFLYATEDKTPGLRFRRLADEEFENLGDRQRRAGWWVLWNPHHLLYLPVTATLYRIVSQVIQGVEALSFLRWWNSVFSALTILLFYFLLIRIVPGSPYVLPWCLFLVTSVTFFRYSTDGAQYPTSIFFLALASGGIWASIVDNRPGLLLRSGFWLAMGILFHQLVSIIAVFLLAGIWVMFFVRKRNGEEIQWKWFLGMAGFAIGTPVLIYVVLGAIALGPTGEFNIPGLFKYATLYAHQESYWTQSIWEGFLTNLITFIGFYFDNPRTRLMFLQSLWFTAIVAILPAIWLTAVLNFRKLDSCVRWWVILCLFWVFPLLVFLSFWVPGHVFYHLFLTIPLGSLAVIGAESSSKSGKRRWVDVALFWLWCVIAIGVNLPESLAGFGQGS